MGAVRRWRQNQIMSHFVGKDFPRNLSQRVRAREKRNFENSDENNFSEVFFCEHRLVECHWTSTRDVNKLAHRNRIKVNSIEATLTFTAEVAVGSLTSNSRHARIFPPADKNVCNFFLLRLATALEARTSRSK